jgi:hypothetical protein
MFLVNHTPNGDQVELGVAKEKTVIKDPSPLYGGVWTFT